MYRTRLRYAVHKTYIHTLAVFAYFFWFARWTSSTTEGHGKQSNVTERVIIAIRIPNIQIIMIRLTKNITDPRRNVHYNIWKDWQWLSVISGWRSTFVNVFYFSLLRCVFISHFSWILYLTHSSFGCNCDLYKSRTLSCWMNSPHLIRFSTSPC